MKKKTLWKYLNGKEAIFVSTIVLLLFYQFVSNTFDFEKRIDRWNEENRLEKKNFTAYLDTFEQDKKKFRKTIREKGNAYYEKKAKTKNNYERMAEQETKKIINTKYADRLTFCKGSKMGMAIKPIGDENTWYSHNKSEIIFIRGSEFYHGHANMDSLSISVDLSMSAAAAYNYTFKRYDWYKIPDIFVFEYKIIGDNKIELVSEKFYTDIDRLLPSKNYACKHYYSWR